MFRINFRYLLKLVIVCDKQFKLFITYSFNFDALFIRFLSFRIDFYGDLLTFRNSLKIFLFSFYNRALFKNKEKKKHSSFTKTIIPI